MSQTAWRHAQYTLGEYLRLEEYSNVKHEFLDGQIFAMAGGTPEHGALCARVIIALGRQLEGRPCSVYSSDVRVRVVATGLDTYPDVSVVCGTEQRDDEDRNALVNPIVIVEALSPSTEAYDRGKKLDHYRKITALQEVVLLAHDAPRVEVWRRAADGRWTEHMAGASRTATLASIGCELEVDRLYRDPLA